MKEHALAFSRLLFVPAIVAVTAAAQLAASAQMQVAQDKAAGLENLSGSIVCPEPVAINPCTLITKKKFGAQFWITNDDHIFLNWNPGGMWNLFPIKETPRYVPLFFPMFFTNPGFSTTTGANGLPVRLSNVAYFWVVIRPNDTIHSVFGPVQGWDGVSPPLRAVSLANGKPHLTFQIIDPPGRYTIKMFVYDQLREITIELSRTVTLKE